MILYTSEGSRGFRASWAAAELGIQLDYNMLPFPPRLFSPSYLEENPLGTVPMLVDGSVRLTESLAICEYLAASVPGTDLAIQPRETGFGHYVDFLHHADATLTFPQTVFLRFTLFEKQRGLAEAGEAYGRWFGARLTKVESRLNDCTYLAGGRFTVADIGIGYSLLLARMTGLDKFFGPNVAFYLERLTARPAFHEAMENERDAALHVVPSVMETISKARKTIDV